MIPKMTTGALMPDISESVKKKQPIGTPALPTAEMTEIRIHSRIVPIVSGVPPFCITKSEVTRIKAAQPFMLMVVQINPRINRNSKSCKPNNPFTTIALFSLSGSFESPMPIAKASNNSDSKRSDDVVRDDAEDMIIE